MKLQQACEILTYLESDNDVNSLILDEVCIWPLVRQTIWFQLLAVDNEKIPNSVPNKSLTTKINKKIKSILSVRRNSISESTIDDFIFVSRPVYLQEMSEGICVDRIVDPLLSALPDKTSALKIYTSKLDETNHLQYKGMTVEPGALIAPVKIQADVLKKIHELINKTPLDKNRFLQKLTVNLDAYQKWRKVAEQVITGNNKIKAILLVGWYFPDMMAFVATAKKYGIKTIDLQHGKQGKYQGMYSWWTRYPVNGYEQMPDYYWCWGKPSCDHIIQSNKPGRKEAVVAGYPWVDYYKNDMNKTHGPNSTDKRKRVLVTLQAAFGENVEPIPDFIVEYLRSSESAQSHFVFRCHPNFVGCISYIKNRLHDISKEKYSVCDGTQNLYEAFIDSTHHITAYSSCCYEASLFGIPTLLFGKDAYDIYHAEIARQMFDWTSGSKDELSLWIKSASSQNININGENQYIVSSLDLSRKLLANLSI